MQNENDVLWENLYTEKPLTFWEFVQKQTRLKELFFPVANALKTYHRLFQINLANASMSEIYVTGPTGIGKGVYIYLILAYRLYLALLLKNPKRDLFNFADSFELSCMFISKYNSSLAGFIHFLQNIQGDDPLFNFTPSEKIYLYEEEKETDKVWHAVYKDNDIVLKHGTSECNLLGTNPIIAYLDCKGCEPAESFRLFEKIKNRIESRFGPNKMFTQFLIEKDPNNLYSDLLDQHIVNTPCLYVERFLPLYMKDIKGWEDVASFKNDYFIDLENGYIGNIETKEDYLGVNPDSVLEDFPADWVSNTGTISLIQIAQRDPKTFINDVLGYPILKPFKYKVEVNNSFDAVATVKKLIEDFNIQVVYEKYGMHLAVPEFGIKVKL